MVWNFAYVFSIAVLCCAVSCSALRCVALLWCVVLRSGLLCCYCAFGGKPEERFGGGGAIRMGSWAKIMYFIRKTTYSNRKFDIIQPNKLIILYLFVKGPFIVKHLILYVEYIILYHISSILTSRHIFSIFRNRRETRVHAECINFRGMSSNMELFGEYSW